MRDLYVALQGVRMGKVSIERQGRITLKLGVSKERAHSIIEVDNYRYNPKGDQYAKRDEPLIVIHNLPDGGSDPLFTGTHQELVDRLNENSQSLLETLFQIAYRMGYDRCYSGDMAADMETGITLAQKFEQEYKNTDWDSVDWYSTVAEYAIDETKTIEKEE